MKEATMPNPKQIEGAHPLLLSALAVLACACAGDVVELGEDASAAEVPSASSTSRCQTSTTLSDVTRIVRQSDLDQLAGCEEIDGDLDIGPFAHPDFAPLASLRVVTGTLTLGASGGRSGDPPYAPPRADMEALLAAGWLDSLEGFENLERVGSLGMMGLLAPSLEPLSNLKLLTTGGFGLIGCQLKDLSGLEGLAGLKSVTVRCDSLQSLRGLSFPDRLEHLEIRGAQLKDLGSLANVTDIDTVDVSNTALENLDGLTHLATTTGLYIHDNPQLQNADAIEGIGWATYIAIEGNDRLEALELYIGHVQQLTVRDNAALRRWPTFPSTLAAFEGDAQSPWSTAASLVFYRQNTVEVSGNPLLESVTLPPGWQGAEYISIENNAALGHIDFSTAHNVTELSIANNAALAHVELGALDTVNALRVSGNPLLPLTEFDGVQTFDRQMSVEPAPGAP
jgi:hypothetical protein